MTITVKINAKFATKYQERRAVMSLVTVVDKWAEYRLKAHRKNVLKVDVCTTEEALQDYLNGLNKE